LLLKIDLAALGEGRAHWRGIAVTVGVNWLIKPRRCRGLKQSHSKRTKRLAIAIIRRSCSDSLLTASRGNGVFGSDNGLSRLFGSATVDNSMNETELFSVKIHKKVAFSPCSLSCPARTSRRLSRRKTIGLKSESVSYSI
jgi:hypothetical protein